MRMKVFSKLIDALFLKEFYHQNKLIWINGACALTVDLLLKEDMGLKRLKEVFLITVFFKRRGE